MSSIGAGSVKTSSVVRDPVHGDIHLTAEELSILDTPEMQRLRGVRQLGTAYLVYPGAQHTRFEHSLGTMHLTQRMIEAINRNRSVAPGERIGVAEDEARILRAAALVHDITHVPFGHNIEDQSGILARHDSASRYLDLLGSDRGVGAALDKMGIRREVLAALLPPQKPRRKAPAPQTGQLGLPVGERAAQPVERNSALDLPEVPPYWREILSDTICSDTLDYLKRDAYFTGLNLRYDDRVLDFFSVDRRSGHLFVDVSKRGLVREDMLSEIVRVLDARYFFSERVYYHHAKIAAGAMVAQVVETAILHGGLEPRLLFEQTDESLWPLLQAHEPPYPEAGARYHELIRRFRSRRLLKRACVFPLYANRDVQDQLVQRFFSPGSQPERVRIESEILQRLDKEGFDPPLVVLYCPARKMQLKEAATHVRFPGTEILPMSRFADRIPRLADLERAYRDLWKLYVLAGTADARALTRIGEIVSELLPGARNVYRPGG